MKWFIRYVKYLIIGPVFYGGGGSAKQPTPPDPNVSAAAQTGVNTAFLNQIADLNRYNQYGPTGNVTWSQGPNGKWNQWTTMSPEQQNLYLKQNQAQTNMANMALNQNEGLFNLLRQPTSGGDLATRQHVETDLFNRLNPQLEVDQNRLAQNLANQGLSPGSEAYNNAMLDQSRRVNDARLAITQEGGQEMQRAQGMDFANRNQALQEMFGLMQGSGNTNLPAYGGNTSVSGAQPVDIAGLINSNYQTQVANANAGQGSKNGLMSGGMGALGSIGGAAMGKYSDERLKTNIEKVGITDNGIQLYHFNYIDGIGEDTSKRYEGVIAQDLVDTNLDCVIMDRNGYLRVDYDKLGVNMREL